jgi:hypothetical protein
MWSAICRPPHESFLTGCRSSRINDDRFLIDSFISEQFPNSTAWTVVPDDARQDHIGLQRP